ncbi:divalent-cation tolerance protein CutA [Thiosocius teredinicola]|uniref:divalent-cation tolerance protein CutA n=1 Tax=Thiosocius teredinicola TaxID=1973002 RepID=UPI000990B046
MTELQLVITTMPDQASAESLAEVLVGQQIAACVNISAPLTSIYRWAGKIERGSEVMLTIKSSKDRYTALERAIADNHPYELPEIIAVPITGGLPDYLAWIETCTKN